MEVGKYIMNLYTYDTKLNPRQHGIQKDWIATGYIVDGGLSYVQGYEGNSVEYWNFHLLR